MMDEFVCSVCGWRIYSVPKADTAPTMCAVCRLLEEEIADPVERAEARRFLREE